MRTLILSFFAICWSTAANSALDADSLNREFAKMPLDAVSMDYIYALYKTNEHESYDVKIVILQWLAIISQKIQDYEMEGNVLHMTGKLMHENGDGESASLLFTAALDLAEKYDLHDVASHTYNSYGVMYYDFGQMNDAIKNYEKAIYHAQLSPTKKGLGGFYSNLATMYFEVSKHNLDSARLAISMMKMSLVYAEEAKDSVGYIFGQNSLVLMYMEIGDLDSAKEVQKDNYRWIKSFGRESDLVFYYIRESEIAILSEDYAKAIDMLETGIVYAEKFKADQWLLIYYEHFRVVYSATKDYEKAHLYGEKYIQVKDSLRSVELYAKSRNIEEKYESEKKQKEILRLNKDYEISQLKLAHEQNEKFIFKVLMVAAFVILILLVAFIIVTTRISKSRKEFIKILEKKNSEIQEQSIILNEKSKQLTRYQCQMNPHFVFNALNTIQGSVMNDNKQKTMDQLHVLGTLMRETMTISQKDLIPLNEEVNYLNRYVYFEQSRLSKKIAFNLDLPEHMESILIPPMLLQPVIENAVKHGGFNRIDTPAVSLKVIEQENCLEIVVEDNGFGFDTQNTAYMKPAHAMEIIHSRLQIIWESFENNTLHNPFLELISKPQLKNGTSCKLLLPLVYKY